MLIAQLSDLHIAGWGKKAYGVAATAENLTSCVAHINQLRPKPDLVIVTGDITFSGLREEAERAAVLLENLDCPWFLVPGNHDDRSILCSVFAQHGCPASDKDFLNYVIEGYEIRLIGMDSSIPDAPGGEIGKSAADWLAQQLADTPEKSTIIFMHHPPVKFGVMETDEDGFIGADRLGALISGYHNVKALLCGHIHLAAHQGWCGTVVSTAPSMGLQLLLDLTLTLPSQFMLEPPGYQLHYFTPESNLVTHTVTVKEMEGTYLF